MCGFSKSDASARAAFFAYKRQMSTPDNLSYWATMWTGMIEDGRTTEELLEQTTREAAKVGAANIPVLVIQGGSEQVVHHQVPFAIQSGVAEGSGQRGLCTVTILDGFGHGVHPADPNLFFPSECQGVATEFLGYSGDSQAHSDSTPSAGLHGVDAVIIGSGFSGMYMLHKLRGLGLKVKVLEAGSDVGGTWFWNRYPGARCDVPSIEYSYSFDETLQQEWTWTELMATQPEILEYANHVADRFSLRSDIEFDTRVSSATYDEASKRWLVQTETGKQFECSFCIMAVGCLSAPNSHKPPFDDLDTFDGPVYHTGQWPHEGVDFTGQSVGIIGTGSSGSQAIPLLAEQAGHLTVFQRTPNYPLPAGNQPLSDEYTNDVKANYSMIRKLQRESIPGFIGYKYGGLGGIDAFKFHSNAPPTEQILQTSKKEQLDRLDRLGFGAIFEFADVFVNLEANEVGCDLYREMVQRIVIDTDTAEKLMPRDYPIGCKRHVFDTGYFDTFNRNNVTLVDLRLGGIERITKDGVQTAQGLFSVDALVLATGFDAMTGPLLRMQITGRSGHTLEEHWQAGPRTYLGLQCANFPNMFIITGPGSPSVLSNMMVSIEQHVEWIAECIRHMQISNLSTIEQISDSEDEGWPTSTRSPQRAPCTPRALAARGTSARISRQAANLYAVLGRRRSLSAKVRRGGGGGLQGV